MKLLDRYVLRTILPPTLLSLLLYVFLLFMNVLFDVIREAVQNQIAFQVVLKLLYYQLPDLLVVTLPMSVLLGTLIGTSRLSADSELVALQSAGIPLTRLIRPVVAMGLFFMGLCFYFIAVVGPEGSYLHHLTKREVYLSRYINSDRIVPRVFHESLPGLLLYYDAREKQTGAFRRVLLYEKDPETLAERFTVARRGELSFDEKSGRVNLYLEDGATHGRTQNAPPGSGYSVIHFKSQQETRAAPAYVQNFAGDLQRNQHEMTLEQLSAEIRSARRESNPVVRDLRLRIARTTWHERFALPAAVLVFALLGLPLGKVHRRGGKAYGFAMSLAMVLVYWVSYTVLRDMGSSGRMNIVTALWLPNLGFAILAIILNLFGDRIRSPLGGWAVMWERLPRWPRRKAGSRPRRRLSHRRAGRTEFASSSFPLLIDRYLIRSFLGILSFVLMAICLAYLLIEFRSMIQDVVDHKVGMGILLKYLVFMLPRMITTVLPIGCLVATLVGLGLMARHHEVTAVKSAGVSVYRLLLPLLAMTALVSVSSFFIQNEILPTTNKAAESLRDTISGHTPRSLDPRHRWIMGEDDHLYHYENSDLDRWVLQGLSIFQLDPVTFALRSRWFAERASYDGTSWHLHDGWERVFNGDESQVETFSQKLVKLNVTPAFFQSEDSGLFWGIQRQPNQMSMTDQRAYIQQLYSRGYDTTALRVALAQKLALPAVPFFMVLLGFPFAFRLGAHGSLFGIGLAIGLSILYWATLAVFNALGTAALVSPLLAAWAPNVFFGGVGIYLILHVRS